MKYKKQNQKLEQIFFDEKARNKIFDDAEEFDTIFRVYEEINKGQLILDAGCGTDAYCLRLAKKGFQTVGIDISSGQVKFAKNRGEKEGYSVPFVVGDLNHMPFKSETFGYVFFGHVLHHFPEITPIVKEVSRVSMKNGKLISVEPNGSNWFYFFLTHIGKIFLKEFFWKTKYFTPNETFHTIKKYENILKQTGFSNVRINLYEIESFQNPLLRAFNKIIKKGTLSHKNKATQLMIIGKRS